MASFIESYKFPRCEWSFQPWSRGRSRLSYEFYLTKVGRHTVSYGYSTVFCCFASTPFLGTFFRCSKFDLVQKKCRKDILERPSTGGSQTCPPRRDRNWHSLQCKLFGPKGNKGKETFVTEVEKERRRLVERIFEACSGSEQKEKVDKVVAAAGFLDSSQRLKLWIHIEQLSVEKLFEASVYNFERAAELRDEASLLRLRDAHVILQESIDEALRRGELGFAKIFYEALQVVGEPPDLKKKIPSQGGETRKKPTTTTTTTTTNSLDTCLEVAFSSSMNGDDDNNNCFVSSNEEKRISSPESDASEQTFVEPAAGSLWDNQEMFGDASIDSEGIPFLNDTQVSSDSMKVSSNNALYSLDAPSKENKVGYSYSATIPSMDSVSETAANCCDKDSNSTTGILGNKRCDSWALNYSEVFHHILKVHLQGKWNMDRSSLSEHYLCFEYQIQIVNTSTEFVQLLSSSGFVETLDGRKHTLAEQIVTDKKPVVQDGECFEYSSFCVFEHPVVVDNPTVGFLQMSFVFVRGDCGQQLFHLETSPVHLRLA